MKPHPLPPALTEAAEGKALRGQQCDRSTFRVQGPRNTGAGRKRGPSWVPCRLVSGDVVAEVTQLGILGRGGTGAKAGSLTDLWLTCGRSGDTEGEGVAKAALSGGQGSCTLRARAF